MNRSPHRLVFSLGLATLLVALVLHLAKQNPAPLPGKKEAPQISQPPPLIEEDKSPPPALLGDRLLAQYGKEEGTIASDMELFSRYLSNVFILVKQRDPRHYATNEDLAEFLLGARGQQEPFLSADSNILNEQGQLVDRLGSPLIIHPLSKDQIEIRSAGPDRLPYTDDDVVK